MAIEPPQDGVSAKLPPRYPMVITQLASRGQRTHLCGRDRPNATEPVIGDARRGQQAGDRLRRVVEENGDLMIVTEVAGGGEGADVDRVEVVHVPQVQDQPQRPQAPHRMDQGVAQLDSGFGAKRAVRPDDESAVRTGYDIDRWFGHRVAFRYLLFSERSE